ncbi:MAG: hypothetical protein V7745_00010 [Pseudomonadales bacterium]
MQASQHHYLQAMGIQVWQSRAVLPGAKPDEFITSAPGQATSDEQNVATIETAETHSPSTPADVPAITPVGLDLVAAQTEQSLPVADVAAEKKEAVVQLPNPEFRIASVIFPGICVVVTEVPVQSVAPIAAEQLTFLKELLLAIKAPIVDEPLVTLFNWPMLRSPDFDQSAEAAREASQAFLRGQKSKHDVGFVLLMGDAPSQYLLSEQGGFAEKTGRLYQSDSQPPRLLTWSLQQIFAESKFKVQVWHDLQPLITWKQEQ